MEELLSKINAQLGSATSPETRAALESLKKAVADVGPTSMSGGLTAPGASSGTKAEDDVVASTGAAPAKVAESSRRTEAEIRAEDARLADQVAGVLAKEATDARMAAELLGARGWQVIADPADGSAKFTNGTETINADKYAVARIIPELSRTLRMGAGGRPHSPRPVDFRAGTDAGDAGDLLEKGAKDFSFYVRNRDAITAARKARRQEEK